MIEIEINIGKESMVKKDAIAVAVGQYVKETDPPLKRVLHLRRLRDFMF